MIFVTHLIVRVKQVDELKSHVVNRQLWANDFLKTIKGILLLLTLSLVLHVRHLALICMMLWMLNFSSPSPFPSSTCFPPLSCLHFQFVVFLSSPLSWTLSRHILATASCSRVGGLGCHNSWSLMGTYSVENKWRCNLSNTHCCPSYFVLWESWIVMYHGFD